MNHSSELRVPEYLYKSRRERLERLIKLDAPRVVLIAEAELFLRCFKWSWRSWWHSWKMNHFPEWLMWLTSAEYRAVCRDKQTDEDFEREMREMLSGEKPK
jgi:hypothetical protein